MLNDYATDVTCMHTTVAKRGNGCDNEWLILKKIGSYSGGGYAEGAGGMFRGRENQTR